MVNEPINPVHAKIESSPKLNRDVGDMKRTIPLLLLISSLFLVACSNAQVQSTVQEPTPSETPSPTKTYDDISLPAFSEKNFDGRDLQVGKVLGKNDKFTRYFVTYKSGELTISGIMNVPTGPGPFPTLVLAHGYIDPKIYTNGRGLAREQKYLAENGFVVLHTDYRNHAQSDDDTNIETNLRLGYLSYTEDVINAGIALKNSGLAYVDTNRLGLLGRSMGGGILFNAMVTKPDLFNAYVAYAPTSSNFVDNFNKWNRMNLEQVGEIENRYGLPEDNTEFWQDISAVNFFDKITQPVLILHGTKDESCPIQWSVNTYQALLAAGKSVEFIKYEGEQHAFVPKWEESIKETKRFFNENL